MNTRDVCEFLSWKLERALCDAEYCGRTEVRVEARLDFLQSPVGVTREALLAALAQQFPDLRLALNVIWFRSRLFAALEARWGDGDAAAD